MTAWRWGQIALTPALSPRRGSGKALNSDLALVGSKPHRSPEGAVIAPGTLYGAARRCSGQNFRCPVRIAPVFKGGGQ
jgi:hypothetical protein